MTTLKIVPVGSSQGVIFPEELLDTLGLSVGDTLMATETSRGVELSRCDERVAKQMEIADKVMREDYEVLKKLAD